MIFSQGLSEFGEHATEPDRLLELLGDLALLQPIRC